eukprot:4332591-Amphidinium_carterae.1
MHYRAIKRGTHTLHYDRIPMMSEFGNLTQFGCKSTLKVRTFEIEQTGKSIDNCATPFQMHDDNKRSLL